MARKSLLWASPLGEMNLRGSALLFCTRVCAGWAECSFRPSLGAGRGCRIAGPWMQDCASWMCTSLFLRFLCGFAQRHAVRCDGRCNALRWLMQCAALAGAACSVFRAGAEAGSWHSAWRDGRAASADVWNVQPCIVQGVGVLVLFPLGWPAYGLLAFGLNCSMVMRSTFTSSSGRSFLSVFMPCMAPTTSSPSMTSPNTVYCPSRCGVPPRIS